MEIDDGFGLLVMMDDKMLHDLFGIKTASCRYCDKPATKKTMWNEGRAMIQTCEDHVSMAKNQVSRAKGKIDEVLNVGEKAAGVDTDPDPSPNPGATKLREYWVHGEGAAKVKWGVHGDFKRCVTHLRKHVGTRAEGLCQVYHTSATGYPAGKGPHKSFLLRLDESLGLLLKEYDATSSSSASATVLSVGYCFEVIGPDASTYTAKVVDLKSDWDWSNELDVCSDVRSLRSVLTLDPDEPVSLLVEASSPQPMFASVVDMGKKGLPHRWSTLAKRLELDPASLLVPVAGTQVEGKVGHDTSGKGARTLHSVDFSTYIDTAALGAAPGHGHPGGKSALDSILDRILELKRVDDSGQSGSQRGSGDAGDRGGSPAAKKPAAKKAPVRKAVAKKAPAKKEPAKKAGGEFNTLHPRNADGTFAYKNDSGKGDAERGMKDKTAKDDGKAHGRIGDAQAALVKAGLLKPTDGRKGKAVDGYFGPKTQAAVLKFQKKMKLKPTGKLDAATLKALTPKAAAKPGAKKPAAKKKVSTKSWPVVVGGLVLQTKTVESGDNSSEGGTGMGAIEYKAVGVSGIKEIGGDGSGVVEAIVSVTGIVDNVKDIISSGVYAKSLATRIPKGVWHHNWHESVSRTEGIKELLPGDADLPEKLPNGQPWPAEAGALKVTTRFNLDTQRGREAYADVKFFGDQQEWSIGYNVPVGGADIDSKTGIRTIKAIDLFEYSPVLFGAMPVARTASIKSAQSVFAALLKEVPREDLLVETKDFLNSLVEDDSVVEGEEKATKKPLAQEEENVDEEMAPGEEADQGMDEEDMADGGADEDEEDANGKKKGEKAMPLSAGQADLVKGAIDALTKLYDSMNEANQAPSEDMAEEKMRKKKRGMGSVGCKSLEELVAGLFDDEEVTSDAKAFDLAVENNDLQDMEDSATAILDVIEKSIEGGMDEDFGEVTDYIVKAFTDATDEEDPEVDPNEEETPEEDDAEGGDEDPKTKKNVNMSLTEFKDLFAGVLDEV